MNATGQNHTNSNVNPLNGGLLQPQAGETTYHAQPYNLDAVGFYFTTLEDYTAKAEANVDRWGAPVEEYELQFIDGTDAEGQLFTLLGINQANLETWFDDVVDRDEREQAALSFVVGDLGYSLADALDKIDDVNLFTGSLLDAATELFDECYLNDIPEAVRFYIDYEAYARDQNLSGAMSELEFAGQTYTVTNADAL
ncbi:antirestriction protein ArdA [Paraburkholderia dilworthii]|uniref:Antirestriction protein ArdA n=1 Tax=Paraburkholderia dilworthii TaxID=948106 RepID=A0ABW9D672_9BURK